MLYFLNIKLVNMSSDVQMKKEDKVEQDLYMRMKELESELEIL